MIKVFWKQDQHIIIKKELFEEFLMSDWTNICGVIRYDTFEDLDVEKAFG